MSNSCNIDRIMKDLKKVVKNWKPKMDFRTWLHKYCDILSYTDTGGHGYHRDIKIIYEESELITTYPDEYKIFKQWEAVERL